MRVMWGREGKEEEEGDAKLTLPRGMIGSAAVQREPFPRHQHQSESPFISTRVQQ